MLSGEDRPDLICGFLAERFENVALTMGQEGCAVQSGGQYLRLEAVAADIVDSTGAGDAFAAAFLERLKKAATLTDAAKAGVRLGAIAVTLTGGRPKEH